MGDLESYASGGGAIIVDSRYYPIVFITWFGTPTVEVADVYDRSLRKLAERSRSEGTKFVIIGDTTDIKSRPEPAVRQRVANAVDRFQLEADDRVLGIYTVLTSMLMRAVFNMVFFLARRRPPAKPVRSLEEAFSRAFESLEAAGVSRPEGLDPKTYQRPHPPLG